MPVSQTVVLHPSAVILYKTFENVQKKQVNVQSLGNLLQNRTNGHNYNGWMSDETKRRTRKMIYSWLAMLQQTSRKPTFVTLTLPAQQQHDDKFIKEKMLCDRFIKAAFRHWKIQNYFWRAEPQANGNIHFHLLFDDWVEWQKVRGEWNSICNSFGYIEAYRQNQLAAHPNGFQYNPSINNGSRQKQWNAYRMKESRAGKQPLSIRAWDEMKQREAYEYGMQTNWSNPNSTDIHALQSVRNAGAYVTKYMTKTPDDVSQYRKIEGRIWGASDALRELKLYSELRESVTDFETGEIIGLNPQLEKYLSDLTIKENIIPKEVDDILTVMFLSKSQDSYLKKYSPRLYQSYCGFYKQQAQKIYF